MDIKTDEFGQRLKKTFVYLMENLDKWPQANFLPRIFRILVKHPNCPHLGAVQYNIARRGVGFLSGPFCLAFLRSRWRAIWACQFGGLFDEQFELRFKLRFEWNYFELLVEFGEGWVASHHGPQSAWMYWTPVEFHFYRAVYIYSRTYTFSLFRT